MQRNNNKGVAGQLHLNTKPNNPEVKTRDVGNPPIIDWINYNTKIGNQEAKPFTDAEIKVAKAVDEYGNQEHATSKIIEQDRQQKAKAKAPSDTRSANPAAFFNIKPTKKMSASRSWQVIKQSMDKDELEEWYKDHPKDRPIKLAPVELDKGLTQMLGEDWLE